MVHGSREDQVNAQAALRYILPVDAGLAETVREWDRGGGEPGLVDVLVHFFHWASVPWVHGQQLVEKLQELGCECLPHARRFHRHSILPLHELKVVWVTEGCLLPGKVSCQHAEEEDAYRPYVAGGLGVEANFIRCIANLWRSVWDASAHLGDVGACSQCHAKVYELHERAFFVSKHNVLWLDVSVHQLLAVHVLHSLGYLVQVLPGLAFAQSNLWLDCIEEVTTWSVVLHHHVRGFRLVGSIVRVDDIGVLRNMLAVLELPLEVSPPGTRLADRLDCNGIPSGLVFCNPGGSIGALTSLPQESETLIQASLVVCLLSSHCRK